MQKTNAMDVLRSRGFIKQVVFEEDLYKLLGTESVTFYIGYDPTAPSLHIGHFVQLMAMAHMQRAGHKPIVVIGGGTAMVADPSGKTDMRTMLSQEIIAENAGQMRRQMLPFLDFSADKPNGAIMVNNADWLLKLNYVDFIRDIGVHFSVNKMLTAECFKQRMEKGLSFLEFNYMLMQSYDFLQLFERYGCVLQLGGDDQWSNILSGADLIRRKLQKPAFAMTFGLLTTADGTKMGKTVRGAIWLDKEKTPPYEFYQYWRNIEDEKVEEGFKILTFVPLEEIAALCAHKDGRINDAKARLAWEITALIHGKAAADEAQAQAKAAFSGDAEQMPSVTVTGCKTVLDALVAAGVCNSRSEARRLIESGGVSADERRVERFDEPISAAALSRGSFVLHKGKKVHINVVLA